MRTKPMLALSRSYRRSLMVAATALLAACAGESTAPVVQHSAPVLASKALSGVVDGVYSYTVTPGEAQTLRFGDSYLVLPANAICSLATSGYGPQTWNAPCAPESAPVVITATIRNAATNNPSIDFQPAMRFNPATNVQLFLQVTNATTLSNMTQMLYCGPFNVACVDESASDASLSTEVDKTHNSVSRRIKHFSGYVVAE
ncbi:MAG: hypothetical protein ABIY52_12150 [Gemmatimonadaceae bacterium]